MSDMLVELSQNPLFRTAVKSMGLPLPTPQTLRRPPCRDHQDDHD